MKIAIVLLQAVAIVCIAPLVSGVIRKIKNAVRLRRGASVFQPYYNLAKLTAKDEVVSEKTSWVFRAVPYVVLASSLAALLIVPFALPGISLPLMGDLVALLFILGLGRFFLALAGLDAASAFGGMGSSREMFISAFAEPVALLAVFAAGMGARSTSPAEIAGVGVVTLSSAIAASALFLVALAETSRIPVDNQETHLELTMVHEAMVLEYSGRSLALIELASHVRQMVFFSLIALVLVPPAVFNGTLAAAGAYILEIAFIAAVVAFLEVSIAKMRLFRVIDFLAFGFILAGMAVIAAIFGV